MTSSVRFQKEDISNHFFFFYKISKLFQVCKKRTKSSNKENSSSKHGNDRLKHVESIRLSSIMRVIDVKETEGG